MLKGIALSATAIAAGQVPGTPALVVKLLGSAIPFIVAPTGTMANNGAVTLGTALGATFANCYLFLPAGAIAAGVPAAASWFYTQMSSATVGTVFNNTYSSGLPTIPTSPTAFVTTGPGAFTGVTGTVNAQAITVAANSLGPNGRLRVSMQSSNNNTAGAKISQWLAGATIIAQASNTTNITAYFLHEWANRGVTNSQVAIPAALAGPNASSGAALYTAIDTTVAQTLQFQLNLAVATDWVMFESVLAELIPG